jgi:hypothetical protein
MLCAHAHQQPHGGEERAPPPPALYDPALEAGYYVAISGLLSGPLLERLTRLSGPPLTAAVTELTD